MQSVSEFYKNAKHGMNPGDNNRHNLAFSVFSKLDIKSVVDFGCGDGSFLLQIQKNKPDIKVCGVEISGPASEAARARNIEVIGHDFNSRKVPLPDNAFDSCFMGEIIEHVFSPDELLKEALRIVKNNGWLFLTTPNLGAWFNRLSLLFGYQPVFTEVSANANAGHMFNLEGAPAGHIRVFTYKALRQVLERNNWRVEKAYGIGLNSTVHAGPRFIYRIVNTIFGLPSINSGIGILARSNK